MPVTTELADWTIVVPLKASSRGKSRIAVDPQVRGRLAIAMAMDTVAAAVGADSVGGVVVVIEDPRDGDRLTELAGVRILRTAAAGLNAAITQGLAAAGPGAVAVLPADLPSLTSSELDLALGQALRYPVAVVADRQGTGTTLLAAASAAAIDPQYGADSLRRHRDSGAHQLTVPAESGLRRDVDHVGDLAGVTGPRTVAVIASTGLTPVMCGSRPA